MKALSILLISGLLFFGCEPKRNSDQMPERYQQQESGANAVATLNAELETGIGDVESHLHISAVLVPQSLSDTVRENITETKKNHIAISTVDLYPPYPETLPVQFVLNTEESFAETPIVLRAKVYREKQPIGDFAAVLGKNTGRRGNVTPPSFTIEGLTGMDAFPETMVIHAEAEVFLSMPGTEESTIDPLTFTTEDLMRKTVILSNPIRINFHAEAPAPTPEP